MPKLVSVEPRVSRKIFLKYDDGVEGQVDLTKTIERNVFDDLNDLKEFSKIYFNENTDELCWPCGVRMCTNALYRQVSLLSLMDRLKISIDNV